MGCVKHYFFIVIDRKVIWPESIQVEAAFVSKSSFDPRRNLSRPLSKLLVLFVPDDFIVSHD